MDVLHNAGIGDFLGLESFLTLAEVDSIRRFFWCGKTGPLLQSLVEACPAYVMADHVQVVNYDALPNRLKNLNLDRLQGQLHVRRHRGSSFNLYPLARIDHLGLPDRYITLHPSTPFNPPSDRKRRDMTPSEWEPVLADLRRRNRVGVVLNSQAEPVPDDPLLINLGGKTSLPEAIEVLKASEGYTGIDSCFAVLATELFEADRLWIRTQNDWLIHNRRYFYPAARDFSFLVPDFHARPYIAA